MYWEVNDRETYRCPDCDRLEDEIIGGFEVHHKNGEPLDNRPENHIGLCRLCHCLREGKKPSLERTRHLRTQLKARINAGEDDASEGHPPEEHTDEGPQETITASMVFAEGVEAYADRESETDLTPWEELEEMFGDTEPKSDQELEEEWAELEEEFGDSDDNQEQSTEESWTELEAMFEDTDDDSEQGEDDGSWTQLSRLDGQNSADD